MDTRTTQGNSSLASQTPIIASLPPLFSSMSQLPGLIPRGTVHPVSEVREGIDSGGNGVSHDNGTKKMERVERRRGAGRLGTTNYSIEDKNSLLEIVARELPLGAHIWEIVAQEYKLWAEESKRPVRDADSLKNNFDKLSNDRKTTGDPTCPPHVRKAKRIARQITEQVFARNLYTSIDDENISSLNNNNVKDPLHGTEENASTAPGREGGDGGFSTVSRTRGSELGGVVGSRVRKRAPGAGGRKLMNSARISSEVLVQSVSDMVQCVSKMADSVGIFKGGTVRSIVEDEMHEVKNDISDMKRLLADVVKNLKH